MTNTVYHYCSVDNFMKIIKSRELWLTNMLTTNDSEELIYTIKIIMIIISDAINNIEKNPEILKTEYENSNKIILSENFEDNIKEEFDKLGIQKEAFNEFITKAKLYKSSFPTTFDQYKNQKIQMHKNFYSYIKETLIKNVSIGHIACFSLTGDILSQWRAYADDGKGVSIGFNTKSLLDTENKKIQSVEMLYVDANKDLNNDIGDILDKFLMNILLNIDNKALLDILLEKMKIYKNPAFKEELEWRMYYNIGAECNEKDKCLKKDKCTLNYDYYYNGRDIVSYYKYPLSTNSKHGNLINEIILGPKCSVAIPNIHKFLITNGFNIQDIAVRKSSASYI